jgi:uncharacterized protein (TIGR00725 family)
MKKLITVFGPGNVASDHTLYAQAELLGTLLANAGYNVVTGGYAGVMEAASKGAREAGAKVIGVTAEVYFARGREANAYLTREIKVKSAVDRLMELIDLADAAIAIGASPGTLIEVMTVWDYMLKKFIKPRPMILVGAAWQGFATVFDVDPFLQHHRESLTYVNDVEQAVTLLTDHFGASLDLPELTLLQ